MPIFNHFSSVELARSLRAFLRLEAGVVRGKIPDLQKEKARSEELQQARERTRRQDGQLVMESSETNPEPSGINPENVVWIFGSARTGSSWLARMMAGLPRHVWWNEPYVGAIVARTSNPKSDLVQRPETIFGAPHKKTWLASVRSMVLSGAAARFPNASREDHLVIKEPNGSQGAPVLMEALPESRIVFLVRDPRDVASSVLDSASPGGWRAGKEPAKEPDDIVRRSAKAYATGINNAKRAFDDHQGRKVLVRYEDLRADTLATLKSAYSSLGIAVTDDELAPSVEKQAWENIPEKNKGKGKTRRKAAPGSWQEDLTPEQVEIVENSHRPYTQGILLLERVPTYRLKKMPDRLRYTA